MKDGHTDFDKFAQEMEELYPEEMREARMWVRDLIERHKNGEKVLQVEPVVFKDTCPICEQGVLVETEEDFLVFSICTHCKSEVADAEQMKINKHSYICDCHRAYGKKCLFPEKYREGGCR